MMSVYPIPPIRLLAMKAVLRTQHGGPGPHKSGSSQDVHGGDRAGSKLAASNFSSGDVGEAWFDYESSKIMKGYSRGDPHPEKDSPDDFSEEELDRLRDMAGWLQKKASTTNSGVTQTFRGVAYFDEQDAIDDFALDEDYVFKGLSATHPDESIASIYSDLQYSGGEGVSVLMEIENPSGITGYVPDQSSAGISSPELIIPSGARYRVTDVYLDDAGVLRVRLYNPGVRKNALGWIRQQHGGPGPHESGSSQDVHGDPGAGKKTSTSTTAAGGKGTPKIKKAAKFSWRDPDGKVHDSDAFLIDEFGALPSSGMGSVGLRGPGKGSIIFTPETMPSHGQSIRAFYSGSDVQDDFVRFYFKGDHLEFSTVSAAESTFNTGWADRGVDNIYKALDRLAAAGVPVGTKVKVRGGKSAFETTL